MDTVTQMASRDATLCGGRQWAAIVRRIRGYPGTNYNTPVSTVCRNGKMEEIRSQEMVTALQSDVLSIGDDKLGILSNEIGTHSIRSGAAMSIYLGECPVYTIMMIGRWSSDSFLPYIIKKLEQFSHNVSIRVLRFESFRNIPYLAPQISYLDPRQRNHPDNAETRNNIGGNLNRRYQLPDFSMFN